MQKDRTSSFHYEKGQDQMEKLCNLCKSLQHTITPWTKDVDMQCFYKTREKRMTDINKIIDDSIHILMSTLLKGYQNIQQITYRNEEIIRKGNACYLFIFFNWDSLHARLNSHYEAWSYKKRSTKKITEYRKSV